MSTVPAVILATAILYSTAPVVPMLVSSAIVNVYEFPWYPDVSTLCMAPDLLPDDPFQLYVLLQPYNVPSILFNT